MLIGLLVGWSADMLTVQEQENNIGIPSTQHSLGLDLIPHLSLVIRINVSLDSRTNDQFHEKKSVTEYIRMHRMQTAYCD